MSEWISVKDRLPKVGTTVIAWKPQFWRSSPVVIVAYSKESKLHLEIIRGDGQWWDGGCQITHWMPLPDPPADTLRQPAQDMEE